MITDIRSQSTFDEFSDKLYQVIGYQKQYSPITNVDTRKLKC